MVSDVVDLVVTVVLGVVESTVIVSIACGVEEVDLIVEEVDLGICTTLSWQNTPLNTSTHVHWKELIPSTHVPLFIQMSDVHSLILI